ncbi:MAG: DNA polymerase III subunit beta [Gammaproteobacteria bacterium]|jgi:DNA polymerase-3 subunit beta|nr:DNA polymerase III subunit beta [Gammaproteobacteria bacterium]
MELTIPRETLLLPLQQVIGAVERKNTKQILGCILLRLTDEGVYLGATDLELGIEARIDLETSEQGSFTLPARKLLDICRALPDGSEIRMKTGGEKIRLTSGPSRFELASFPAEEFPRQKDFEGECSVSLSQESLRNILERVAFAMAQQDVRYYLNGLLLEVAETHIRGVATDGHRLAMHSEVLSTGLSEVKQVILPRKAVQELLRLLDRNDSVVNVDIDSNHIRVAMDGITFVSKLIDARYPDYNRVIPGDDGHLLVADRDSLVQALSRAAILSNDKYRGVRLILSQDLAKLEANNPEQEQAEEQLPVTYSGPEMEIGFNVQYLMDALSAIDWESVEIHLTSDDGSALIKAPGDSPSRYVVMPMRL